MGLDELNSAALATKEMLKDAPLTVQSVAVVALLK